MSATTALVDVCTVSGTGRDEDCATTATVLIVEDEDGIRSLVREVLEMIGYQVLEASTGDEALALLDDRETGVDLLITDVMMPQMGGRELSDRVLPMRPEMRVLFMSGFSEDTVLGEGISRRQVAFLEKPFSVPKLVETVASVLDDSYEYGD